MKNTFLLLLLSFLLLASPRLSTQTPALGPEEAAVKAVIERETEMFFGGNLEKWSATRTHTENILTIGHEPVGCQRRAHHRNPLPRKNRRAMDHFSAFLHLSTYPLAGDDQEAIKKVLREETQAYMDADIAKWTALHTHDENETAMWNNGDGTYGGFISWAAMAVWAIDDFSKRGKYTDKLSYDNYRFTVMGNMAFVAYDQMATVADGKVTKSREHDERIQTGRIALPEHIVAQMKRKGTQKTALKYTNGSQRSSTCMRASKLASPTGISQSAILISRLRIDSILCRLTMNDLWTRMKP